MTILVADDKASSREFVRIVLEHAGYTVVEAGDGQEALDKIRECSPDVVLLDLHMPVLDGFSVIRKLREEPQHAALPVFALTASAMAGDQERALSLGFTGYLTKPIAPATLRSELQRLVKADR